MTTLYSVMTIGRYRLRPRWRSETLHGLPGHRLFWITKGQGRVTAGCITRGFGGQTAIFVPAGTPMSIEFGASVQGMVVDFPPDPALGLPGTACLTRATTLEAQIHLTGHIEQIERTLKKDAPGTERALKAHALLVSVWLEQEMAGRRPDQFRDKRFALVRDFAILLEKRFRSGDAVADYAKALGVTATHLSRLCKEASGRPAHALLTERVMHEARRLLLDTDMTARDVSGLLGFSSPAYFTRAFAQVTGQTPTEFRTPRRSA